MVQNFETQGYYNQQVMNVHYLHNIFQQFIHPFTSGPIM